MTPLELRQWASWYRSPYIGKPPTKEMKLDEVFEGYASALERLAGAEAERDNVIAHYKLPCEENARLSQLLTERDAELARLKGFAEAMHDELKARTKSEHAGLVIYSINAMDYRNSYPETKP
jgi:hypothetical protein